MDIKIMEVKYMMKLDNFVGMMTGHFDNNQSCKRNVADWKISYEEIAKIVELTIDEVKTLDEKVIV
ncbi:hypothetical protein RUMLAC_02511 [[Ruminococcus] lactaris ATCC 29176]|uniref:Uncharacterized protein n=2 Tax=[Ruminococcus] lactaris TaxID=46228 RepID=B5CSQ0_9FIRM|nr:hypothetical protein RUMLAC_02511 [[Ruminococcus] lactaris ATCC 29176]